jgi:hypothetical protein
MSLLRALACLPLAVAGAILPRPNLPTTPLSVPHRTLHGPGPSTAHPRVLATSSLPMLGHMHPEFGKILSDAGDWMRYAFQARALTRGGVTDNCRAQRSAWRTPPRAALRRS